MKQLTIKDLKPGTDYVVQIRAKNDNEVGEWSKKFEFTTTSDNVPPKAPTNVTWVASGDSFYAEWDAVTENVDDSEADIISYELVITLGSTAKTISLVPTARVREEYVLSYAKAAALFGTPSPSPLKFKVRAQNEGKNYSAYSSELTAFFGPPGVPTNGQVEELTELLKVTWDAPLTGTIDGYRVYWGGSNSSFIPSNDNKVYDGSSKSFDYATTGGIINYFKITAFNKFGESAALLVSGTAISPYGPDETAPTVPTTLSVTAGGVAPNKVANVTWAFNATGDDEDVQNFAIRWRKVGDTNWGIEFTDKDARSLSIPLPQPFANYEFQISAVDWVANYSPWSSTVTLSQSIPGNPPQVTGLSATGSVDGLAIKWTASTAADVINGGYYEVNVATNNTFTTGLLTYKTGNTYLDINGLASNTTYYVRVRAVDVEPQTGAWSATVTTATTAFPVTPLSDGIAPTSSPAATVSGGIGYLFVSWPATTNADAVTYEVHLSTTSGFTPAAGTKVAETSATNIILEKTPAGADLAYGTTYYVKIIAKDRDGSAAAGTQGSGTPIKGTINDLTLAASDVGAYTTTQTDNAILASANGKNKITYATAAPVNGTNTGIVGDTWYVRQSTTPFQITAVYELTTAPSTWTSRKINGLAVDNLDAASVTTGFLSADRLQAASINVTKLVVSDTSNLIKEPRFEFGGGGWTDINGSTIAVVPVTGAASATNALRITSNGTGYPASYMRDLIPVKPGEEYHIIGELFREANAGTLTVRAVYTDKNNSNATYQGILVSGATNTWQTLSGSFAIPPDKYFLRIWVEHALGTSGTNGFVTGLNLRRRQTGELIVDGSIGAQKITAGTYTGGEFIIGSGGILRTNNSAVTITDQGITVTAAATGGIAVDKLTAGTIGATGINLDGNLTIRNSGYIQSLGYIATGQPGATGFRLSAAGLDVTSGTVAAGVLKSGTITSADIRLGANGVLTVDGSTGQIKSNNYNGTGAAGSGTTGWSLSYQGLDLPGLDINVGAGDISGGTFTGGDFVIGSGGSITSSGFSLSSTGLSLTAGTINGAAVYTNQLRSNTYNSSAGRYTFNINGSGYAEFVGATIYQNMTVGSGTANYIESPNYSSSGGASGWRIDGNGNAYFNSGTFKGNITANSIASGTDIGGATGTFTGNVSANNVTATTQFRAGGASDYITINSSGRMQIIIGGQVRGNVTSSSGQLNIDGGSGPLLLGSTSSSYTTTLYGSSVGTAGSTGFSAGSFSIQGINVINASGYFVGPGIQKNTYSVGSVAAGGITNGTFSNNLGSSSAVFSLTAFGSTGQLSAQITSISSSTVGYRVTNSGGTSASGVSLHAIGFL